MTRHGVAVCLLTIGLSAASVSSQTTPPAPRLVLVLAIDQMRFDYLTRFGPLYKGGFRRLLDRGAVFANAHYRHAASETGPGYAVMLTGRHPSHSGIIANDWYDAYLGKAVNVVEDPVQTPLGGPGRRASPANLQGFTVGDVLKARSPASRVVGVSLKDRSAILMAGRRADGAYWYESAGGNFITSSYYMPQAPDWLLAWNKRRLPDQYAGKSWTRLLPDAAQYDRYAGKDAIEGEWDRKDIVFPHVIRGTPPAVVFYENLRRTPFADDLTLDVTLEAMRAHRIGDDAITDILAIGFAATDVIGHSYGPDSHEVMDQLLRLDLLLERLFAEVEATVGLANTVVVLTSDHGVAPLVENLQAAGLDAKRALPALLQDAVTQALEARFPGVEPLLRFYVPPDFYLNENVMRDRGLNRKDVEATAIKALLGTGLVARVYTHDDLRSGSDLVFQQSGSDLVFQLFKNSFYEPRSPHLTVLLKPYVYLSSLVGGTGHGTAYHYDRHVPIVFMGPRIRPGVYRTPAGPEDIAPTLAVILGLRFPAEQDARVLLEMLTGN